MKKSMSAPPAGVEPQGQSPDDLGPPAATAVRSAISFSGSNRILFQIAEQVFPFGHRYDQTQEQSDERRNPGYPADR